MTARWPARLAAVAASALLSSAPGVGSTGGVASVPADSTARPEPPMRQLTRTPSIQERQAAWSRDGAWICYVGIDESGAADLRLVSPDGEKTRLLTTDRVVAGSPSWSADGKRIAFHSSRGGGASRVWILDLADSSITQLTHEEGRTRNPAWSPDGEEIAYYGIESGDEQIWKMPANGGPPRRLTLTAEQSWNPTWSPDGTRIAFSRYNVSSGGALFVMSAAGESDSGAVTRPLTHRQDHRWDRYPDWSPDGNWIAFAAADLEGNSDIWLVSADGKVEERVTRDAATDTEPSWSPDSRHIVFESDRSGNVDLWILDADRWTASK
jgi:Tol biopolymer transport system component